MTPRLVAVAVAVAVNDHVAVNVNAPTTDVDPVVLDASDGVPGRCTLEPEWIRAVPRTTLGPWIGGLPETRWREVRSAVLAALGLDETSAR